MQQPTENSPPDRHGMARADSIYGYYLLDQGDRTIQTASSLIISQCDNYDILSQCRQYDLTSQLPPEDIRCQYHLSPETNTLDIIDRDSTGNVIHKRTYQMNGNHVERLITSTTPFETINFQYDEAGHLTESLHTHTTSGSMKMIYHRNIIIAHTLPIDDQASPLSTWHHRN